jgi:hypothetical protein
VEPFIACAQPPHTSQPPHPLPPTATPEHLGPVTLPGVQPHVERVDNCSEKGEEGDEEAVAEGVAHARCDEGTGQQRACMSRRKGGGGVGGWGDLEREGVCYRAL